MQVMEVLAPSLPWIARKLSCPVELLFQRSHIVLDHIFITTEDFKVEEAIPVLLHSFVELREDVWEGSPHLATSPIPQLTRTDPTLAAKGLGKMGFYVILQGLWRELVPECFLRGALNYNVEAHPNGGSGLVAEMASTLMNSGVISETPLPPSCFPFIIPKSSKKVNLIVSCLGMSERIGDPPTFHLPSWEGLAQKLSTTPRSRRLFCTHVDLTNAVWEFSPPPRDARSVPFSEPAGWPHPVGHFPHLRGVTAHQKKVVEVMQQRHVGGHQGPHQITQNTLAKNGRKFPPKRQPNHSKDLEKGERAGGSPHFDVQKRKNT